MIPQFPEFKNLELGDKEEFEKITKKFEPYSDFNFISLWSYNTENDAEISILNENLVIKFRDYITNDPFYSFIGDNKSEETITLLHSFAKAQGIDPSLKLIPEVNIGNMQLLNYSINEDRDNFDYIISVDEIAILSGGKYHTHKNFVNRFNKTYMEAHIRNLDLLDPAIHEKIFELFYKWELQRNRQRTETVHELSALGRLLKDANNFDLVALGVYDKEVLIGFMIASLEQMDYAMGHFTKADSEYQGIYYFIYHSLAKILLEKGYKYFNNEQDMGIEGLRKSKEQWNPVKYLKKYVITDK